MCISEQLHVMSTYEDAFLNLCVHNKLRIKYRLKISSLLLPCKTRILTWITNSEIKNIYQHSYCFEVVSLEKKSYLPYFLEFYTAILFTLPLVTLRLSLHSRPFPKKFKVCSIIFTQTQCKSLVYFDIFFRRKPSWFASCSVV